MPTPKLKAFSPEIINKLMLILCTKENVELRMNCFLGNLHFNGRISSFVSLCESFCLKVLVFRSRCKSDLLRQDHYCGITCGDVALKRSSVVISMKGFYSLPLKTVFKNLSDSLLSVFVLFYDSENNYVLSTLLRKYHVN